VSEGKRANLANNACVIGLPETTCILMVREELSFIFHRDLCRLQNTVPESGTRIMITTEESQQA